MIKHYTILILLCGLASCAHQITTNPLNETLLVDTYFCPQDDCGKMVEKYILAGSDVDCAFYDLRLENVIDALNNRNARVVIDDAYYSKAIDAGLIAEDSQGKKVIKDTPYQLMHHKFCIINDEIVVTGSFNPTHNGNEKNNNNLIVIRSRTLAQSYRAEFEQLWSGKYGKDKQRVPTQRIIDNTTNISIQAYFCPQDWCATRIIEILSAANESIRFMTFSFTHDAIGDILLEKINENISVTGVFEKQQNNQWHEAERLFAAAQNRSNAAVFWDANPYKLHHKVWIIDDRIVITGSMNPTRNGDEVNDENIVIIKHTAVARAFIAEFARVSSKTTTPHS